jgi:hypothetical protein
LFTFSGETVNFEQELDVMCFMRVALRVTVTTACHILRLHISVFASERYWLSVNYSDTEMKLLCVLERR